jgi:hypothetical protein
MAVVYWLLSIGYCLCTPAVLAPAIQAPVLAVARAAVFAAPLPAPVLAVARAAVLALALPVPVVAVARAAVLAHVLLAPVLAAARAAVLAPARPAPVVALLPWWCTWGLPALTTAIPAVILGAASTAAPVCVRYGATSARKAFSLLRLLRLLRGWLLKLLNVR